MNASAPLLVRLPSSHRGRSRVASALGYEPHSLFSHKRNGTFARLVPEDAQKLFTARLATSPRIDPSELHGCWYQPDPFRGLPPKDERCAHDPRRLYTWHAGDVLCVCCCECGTVLKGGVS